MIRALIAILVALTSIGQAAPELPDVRETVAHRLPSVKGAFPAAGDWSRAEEVGPMLSAGWKRLPPVRSMIRTLCDDKALYLRVRCDDPNAADLKSADTRGVFYNDCVEFFFAVPGSKETVAHLAVDVANRRHANDDVRDKSAWRTRVERDAKGFTVYAAVPYASLGWPKPGDGDAWKIKVGRESKTGGGNSMWPYNPDQGFHSSRAWGWLYFGKDSFLPNGDFERKSRGERPAGWACITGNKTWGTQGTIKVVASPLAKGGSAVEIRKVDPRAWYPQLRSPIVDVKPGTRLLATAWVRCDRPWVLRYFLMGKGRKGKKLHKNFDALPEPRRVAVPIDVKPPYSRVAIGFQISPAKGVLVVDRVRLRKYSAERAAALRVKGLDPHPIHRLIELSRRRRIVPRDSLTKDGKVFASERVIFKDTATGATIWKMTRWPGYSRHIYSNMRAWNADGSYVYLRSDRDGMTKMSALLLAADGSFLKRVDVAARQWCAVRPDRLYCVRWLPDGKNMQIYWYDPFTGKTHNLPRLTPRGGMIPVSQDGRKLLIVHGGYSRTSRKSVGYLVDVATGKHNVIDFGFTTHQVWFTKRPDYTISFNYEVRNKHFKESGNGSNLINADGTKRRRIRRKHCSHRGFSPDGERVAFHGGGIRVMDWDGKNEKVAARLGSGHLSWGVTPEWLLVTAGNSIRCVGMKGQGFTYAVSHPNTQLGFSEYLTEAHLESSPDGTKIGYASSMMGDTDFYQVVSRQPGPPRDVKATVRNGRVSLAWRAPAFSKEVKGYLVYRSDASGVNYRQATPQAVAATTFAERAAGRATYYVVTAVENSGLEGRPSAEVCASPTGPWVGPVRHYYEIEDATPTKPLMEHYDSTAFNEYALRMAGAAGGQARLAVDAPRAGVYHAWLRARAASPAKVKIGAGPSTVSAEWPKSSAYEWRALGKLTLRRGTQELALSCEGSTLRIDALYLTDQASARPEAKGLRDTTPPAAPKRLRATHRGGYEIGLAWDGSPDADVAYYNVYASTVKDFAPRQEQRVASPGARRALDWGLEQGTSYHYRVTAVDRRGNESAPSPQLSVRTKPAGGVVLRKRPAGARPVKAVKGARRLTTEDLVRMGATAKAAVLVNKAAPLTVTFDVPRAGRYLLWIKFAPTKQASRRAVAVLRVNGKAFAWRPPFNFVSFGHAGATPGIFMWDAAPERTRKGFQAPKGRLKVELTSRKKFEAEVAEVVLTDDFGWRPDGITCWLPVNPPWLREPVARMPGRR